MTLRGKAAIAAVLLARLLDIASPVQAATYKIKWLLGHKNLDYFEEAALDFKHTVEKGSRGDISIEIVTQADDNRSPNPAQGPEIASVVSRGEAEMGHSFTDVMGGLDPRLHAFEAPYLFRGYRHLEGVFEGPVGSELLEGLRAHGIVGLSFTYSGGASGVATPERELRRPEDLKGLKVGVFGDEVNAAWLNALGATAVPIEHRLDRILPLAQDRGLDAVVITWRNFEREDLQRGFNRVSLMGSTHLVSVTYINEAFFNGLPKAYRELLTKASREAGRIERAKTIKLNESAKLEMLDKGIGAVHLSQANRALFEKALEPAYKGSIERVIGKDLIERIKSTGDAPEHPLIPADLAKR